MGIVGSIFTLLFGGGRNVVADTVEVFRENAEAGAERAAMYRSAALGQFASEFAVARKGWFDRFMDGLNRLPRPAMAIGTLALFISAMWDPIWFASHAGACAGAAAFVVVAWRDCVVLFWRTASGEGAGVSTIYCGDDGASR